MYCRDSLVCKAHHCFQLVAPGLYPFYIKGHVADLYAVKTAVVNAGSSINSVIKEFNSSSTNALPYMENNKVKGMLKRNGILKTMLSLHMLSDKKVSEAMSFPILVIEQDEDVRRAKELMEQYKVKKLPVASAKGEIYGVLRYSDIIRFGMKGASRSSKSNKGTVSMSGTRAGDIATHDFRTVDFILFTLRCM